jgi:hypothetical protein
VLDSITYSIDLTHPWRLQNNIGSIEEETMWCNVDRQRVSYRYSISATGYTLDENIHGIAGDE